jgi:glycosyltransferase involved in cell wall biosynthesis
MTRAPDAAAGRLRVLHVTQSSSTGLAQVVADWAAIQVGQGMDVTIACPGNRLGDLAPLAGARFVRWRSRRSPGPWTLGEGVRLARLLAAERPDLVHLHTAKAGLLGRLLLRGRVPTVFSPHAWSFWAASGAVRWAAHRWEVAATRWTHVTVCVGQAELAAGRAAGIGGRVVVVPNAVDPAEVRATASDAAAARARATTGEGPLVVCAARLARQKGQDVLLAAWPRIRAALPTAELALVGDGDLAESLIAAPPPGVRFTGGVPDVRDWLAAADVVVVPSRWEGLPLIALEAMATGRSVVASAIPGLVEVVEGSVGALVPPDDPAALAEALTRRLGMPKLSTVEGLAAARHAGHFDTRRTHERLAATTLALAAGTLSDADDQEPEGVPEWPR